MVGRHQKTRVESMWFIGAIVGLLIAVIAHAAFCRTPAPLNVVTRFLLTGGLVGAGLVLWLLNRYGMTAPQTGAGAAVYAFSCELYVFLFTFAMSSVTANLVASLSWRDLTDAEIEQLYDSRSMVATRLDRLIAVGLVEEQPKGLRLTADGARLVRTFGRLRDLFGHPQPKYNFSATD
jgi:hypothetical protein